MEGVRDRKRKQVSEHVLIPLIIIMKTAVCSGSTCRDEKMRFRHCASQSLRSSTDLNWSRHSSPACNKNRKG